ncbi:DUF397 domain-containing protein [Actinoallomurus sp. NPDC052274]
MQQVIDWRTSARSNTSSQGECVEVAVFEDERSA